MKKGWWEKFWDDHGSRLLFMGAAVAFGVVFWFIGLKAESKTLLIGIAMLCFNKARGNGQTKP